MYKSFILKRKILIICCTLLLILSAGLMFGFLSSSSASASGFSNVFYYAESDYSTGSGAKYASGFSTDINNSNAVVSKTYYFQITSTTYEELDSSYNHLVVSWGRKAEMDILAPYSKGSSSFGDPDFHLSWSSGIVDNRQDIITGDDFYFNYILYSELPSVVTFPYVGYRVQQSDVVNNNGRYYVPVTVTWAENGLFDIGIMITYQHSTIFGWDNRINSYYVDDTVVYLIENAVSHASSYDQNTAGAYEKALGIYRGGNTTVNYSYIKMVDGHFNKGQVVTESVTVPSVYVPDKEYVWNRVLACDYVDGKELVGFNATYTSYAAYEMTTGEIGEKETFGSKIIRQANGYTYSYSGGVIPATVSCDVSYSDFKYSDFYIRISNSGNPNDEEITGYFPNNLLVDVYPTSVEIKNNKTYLYFDYGHIITLFGNTLNWSVLRPYFDITYNPDDVKNHVSVYEETVVGDNKRLVVAFDNGYENRLFGLEITGNAPITEPVLMDCTVEYKAVDENLSISSLSFSVGAYWDNKLGELKSELLDREGGYADYIYGAINPMTLDGIEFIRPTHVESLTNYDNLTARLQVFYEYPSSVLVIVNNVNSEKWVFNLPDTIAEYSLELLGVGDRVPVGYRIAGFSSNRFVVSDQVLGNEIKTLFHKSDSHKEEPYLITLNLSDKWPVYIDYFEQYKNSCFAVLKTFDDEIRVADYSDIFALTGEDVSNILGQDVEVLHFLKKSVCIDKVNVTYDFERDCYCVKLTYSFLSLKTIDSNGNSSEIQVGLTPFSFWQEYFGENWSILYLAPDVFEFSNEVAADELYGFFSVVVFKEQLKNFNSWFRNFTGDGCARVFSERKVEGSLFYKAVRAVPDLFADMGRSVGSFFGTESVGGGVGTVSGNPFPAMVAEMINDDNGEYFTYFFYLDGTTDKPYASHSGADSYDDESSAASNAVEDIGKSVKSTLDDIGDWFARQWEKIKNSTVFKVILIVLAVIAGIIVLSLLIKFLIFIFRKRQ